MHQGETVNFPGPEFDELDGHILVMYKALYGTWTAGACWHDRLFDVLRDMNFVPSKADADDWMRPATDESCSEYIAVYVDDLAITATNPKEITDQTSTQVKLQVERDRTIHISHWMCLH